MSGIELLGTMLSTGVGAVVSLMQGQQQKAVYDYNASVARANADNALAAGSSQEADMRASADRQMSRQQAAFGASGVALGTGSALQIMTDNVSDIELKAHEIRMNAQSMHDAYDNKANLFSAYGDAAETTSYFNAGASLLTGTTKLASSFSKNTGYGR